MRPPSREFLPASRVFLTASAGNSHPTKQPAATNSRVPAEKTRIPAHNSRLPAAICEFRNATQGGGLPRTNCRTCRRGLHQRYGHEGAGFRGPTQPPSHESTKGEGRPCGRPGRRRWTAHWPRSTRGYQLRRQSGAGPQALGQSVDLIHSGPPFSSNRNHEVFWSETKERRAFEDRHPSRGSWTVPPSADD